MRINILVLLLFSIFAGSCQKGGLSGTPKCINTKIEEFKKTACKGSGNVSSYDFQGSKVYVFDAGTCIADGGTDVLDENCNRVCMLGGIAGNTKCKGVEFDKEAKNRKIIWESK